LKNASQIFSFPPKLFVEVPRWSNYATVVQQLPFGLFMLNSFKISSLCTLGQLISCSLAAYAFARMRFRGRDLIFSMLLATMMIPYAVRMIPVFLIMRSIGWLDTHLALIVPSYLGGAFGTFLLRQFFLTIPTELEDAARIDGCGHFGIYRRIVLPLSRPALASLAVFIFIYHWNDLLSPVIYLSSRSKMTISVGLALFQSLRTTQWHLLMAGATISVIPVLMVYVFAQRFFIRGIALTGLKG
jgi:multiple sugar transport system permease protein